MDALDAFRVASLDMQSKQVIAPVIEAVRNAPAQDGEIRLSQTVRDILNTGPRDMSDINPSRTARTAFLRE